MKLLRRTICRISTSGHIYCFIVFFSFIYIVWLVQLVNSCPPLLWCPQWTFPRSVSPLWVLLRHRVLSLTIQPLSTSVTLWNAFFSSDLVRTHVFSFPLPSPVILFSHFFPSVTSMVTIVLFYYLFLLSYFFSWYIDLSFFPHFHFCLSWERWVVGLCFSSSSLYVALEVSPAVKKQHRVLLFFHRWLLCS